MAGLTRPPLIFDKREEITQGRKVGRVSKTSPPPPTPRLAQSQDLPPAIINSAFALWYL